MTASHERKCTEKDFKEISMYDNTLKKNKKKNKKKIKKKEK